MGHSHGHSHGGKNTTSNNPDSAKSLGNQNYEVDDMGTDSTFKYQQLTGTPVTTILTKESDGELLPSEIAKGIYKRVILIRFNGIIREVLPDEYDEYKDMLAKGIYTPIEFMWALSEQPGGLTVEEFNDQQVSRIIKLVDGPLVEFVKSWFVTQIGIDSDIRSGTSAKLAVEPELYRTPLGKD